MYVGVARGHIQPGRSVRLSHSNGCPPIRRFYGATSSSLSSHPLTSRESLEPADERRVREHSR